jgi:hypothetical protein
MLGSEILALADALEKINNSASFAHKYGPFFFAVTLLLVAPIIALAIFKRSVDKSVSDRNYESAYKDFRFFFRTSLLVGFVCVAVAVGWWIYQNYREVDQTKTLVADLTRQVRALKEAIAEKKYAVIGLIVDGVREHDEFTPTFSDHKRTIFFSRLPQTNDLLFLVLSDEDIPPTLEMVVSWGQYDHAANTRSRPVSLPIQMKLTRNGIGQYRFKLDGETTALIMPKS